jgi:site-specific recombinase
MSRIGTILGAVGLLGFSSLAVAGEADDLQRMIDSAKQAASDLERLDEQKAVREEVTLLRVWLDAAWRLRSDQKYDEVRVVLDRCQAQGDMIRQKILAAKASSEAARKEDEVRLLRDKIAKTKEAIQAATLQKAALDGKVK